MVRKVLALSVFMLAGMGSMLILAPPSWAHHALVSGVTSCTDGAHEIDWSIGNSQARLAMTIDSAEATIGANTYSVSGYTSPVPGNGSTSATTLIPGNIIGTVTVSLAVSWPDGVHKTGSAPVVLTSPCTVTTTTTMPTTTTTVPPTTAPPTTAPPATTTTLCSPSVPPCAFTGGQSTRDALVGVGALLGGSALIAVGRRRKKP